MSAKTLLEKLAPMPDEATVPVRWIREQLADEPRRSFVDMKIEEAAALLGWAPSTLRNHMPELKAFGAWKLGRRWMIPEQALRDWQEWRATGGTAKVEAESPKETTDLSAWRKERAR